MAQPQLASTYINPYQETLPYVMEEDQAKGIRDLLALYSPNGPVRKAVTYFGEVGGLPLHVGHAEFWDFDYILRRLTGLSSLETGFDKTLYSGGKGHTLSNMYLSSMGETVERVAGAFVLFIKEEEPLVYGTYSQMVNRGYNCLSPADIPLFAEEQYASGQLVYQRFTEDSNLAWIEGTRLISGEKVWVPAQLVLLFYTVRNDENMIGYASTGGLASHINRKEALYHGITELIERDAVNMRWNCRRAPERITIDRPLASKPLENLIAAQTQLSGKFNFYVQTVDMPEIPVITVLQFLPSMNTYSYYAGGGVEIDIDAAMLSALNEYGQSERSLRLAFSVPNRSFAHNIKRVFYIEEDAPLNRFDIFYKVIVYYGYPQNARKLDWYLNGPEIPLSSLATDAATTTDDKFDQLLAALKKYKIDPITFDFTPPQMQQMKLMKVFIPELTPPYVAARPILGHPRYYTLPQQLGWTDTPLTYADMVGLTEPLPYP